MTRPFPEPELAFAAIDLPSLLATTAARQAMTPTAQMQARLASTGPARRTPNPQNSSASFNPSAQNRMLHKNAP